VARCLRTPAAGSSAPVQRPRRTSRKEPHAPSVWAAPPPSAPRSGAAGAASLARASWDQRTVSEGPKGPMTSAFARQRVTLGTAGLPERPVWLVIPRPLGGALAYASSSRKAPARPSRRTCGWRSGLRWAVEPCVEAGTTAREMAPYAVRTYPGGHHPRLTTRLAPCFLWHLQLRVGEKSARADGVAAAEILGRRLALAHQDDGRGPRRCGVGPMASSPCVSLP